MLYKAILVKRESVQRFCRTTCSRLFQFAGAALLVRFEYLAWNNACISGILSETAGIWAISCRGAQLSAFADTYTRSVPRRFKFRRCRQD